MQLGPETRRKSRDETRRDTRRSRPICLETKTHETRCETKYIRRKISPKILTQILIFLSIFFVETENFLRDGLARQTHETRRDRDGLISSRLAFFRDETVSLPALSAAQNSAVFSPQGPIYEEPLRGAGDALPGGAPYYGGGGQPLVPQNRPYQLYQDQPPPSQFYYSGDGRSAAMAGAPSSEAVDPWYSAGEQPTYGFGDVPYDSLVNLRSITQMWNKVSLSFF